MLSTYKGKGDVLDSGSHRGIKLIVHVMKVLERLVEKKVKSMGTLDSMQFGLTSGKGTTDAINIVRQLRVMSDFTYPAPPLRAICGCG